ncbi:MAG TPA: acetyl-CoA carboxylase biotin carboxyl carrier protein [Steroidobacteraceae bacterium]|jgi:acetyl-CoA carboxylase biotin carboxyl carrier protein
MTLTAADVAEIMRLVEQSGFDELNLEIDGTKISLRRGAASSSTTAAAPLAAAAPVTAQTPAAPASAPASRPSDPGAADLPSPLLGTFYRSPKPGAPPFVQVGSQVETDTIIGIIEVMKLMNTVRAGMRGTVAEIIAADGALVEYGETLLRIRKTD